MSYITLQLRGDTAAAWTTANPVLAEREMALETDTGKFKIGNGATAWNSLAYGGITGPQGDPGLIQGITAGSGIKATEASGVVTLESGGATSVEITGASATLALTHANRFVKFNNATAQTITIPPQSSVAWPADAQIEGAQWGAGAVTFVAGSGVTIRKSSKITATSDAQYAAFGLKRIAANEWLLFGNFGSA